MQNTARLNNMDLIRYYLAFSVLIAHFNYICDTDIPWLTSSYNAVGGFFAMSGFLIFKSYIKHQNISKFLKRRFQRIFPPYLLIVSLCAFGLFFISNETFQGYFLNPEWIKYLVSNLCFLNFIEPSLPGVFDGNAINGSLWTIKIEWTLYLSVPLVCWILKKLKIKKEYLFALLYIFSVIYRLIFLYLYEITGVEIYNILSRQVFGQLMYFYTGVIFYYKKEIIMKWKLPIFLTCIIILIAENYIYILNMTVVPAAISIVVLMLSFWGKWGYWASNINNLSYDIYLFHFPIIQLVFFLGIANNNKPLIFLISLSIIILLSSLSWFLLEKPILFPKYVDNSVENC